MLELIENVSFRNISKFRGELMGCAIIGVFIGHIVVFGRLQYNMSLGILMWLASLIHTSGFLFLSGFGLYYSMNKDFNWLSFYKRRFIRFMLPFLIVAVPYFLIVTINKHESIWYYLRCISTIEFWVNGNYHGMWYIAISLFLYAIFPPLYWWLSQNNSKRLVLKVFGVLLLILCINFLLSRYFVQYWNIVSIGVSRIPYFILGTLIAYYSSFIKNNQFKLLIGLALLYIFSLFVECDHTIIGMISLLMFILIISVLFSYISNNRMTFWIIIVFRWFGKYSFELYILHLYLYFIIKQVLCLRALENIVCACFLAVLLSVPMHFVTTKICDFVKSKI